MVSSGALDLDAQHWMRLYRDLNASVGRTMREHRAVEAQLDQHMATEQARQAADLREKLTRRKLRQQELVLRQLLMALQYQALDAAQGAPVSALSMHLDDLAVAATLTVHVAPPAAEDAMLSADITVAGGAVHPGGSAASD